MLVTIQGKAAADVADLIERHRKGEQVEEVVLLVKATMRSAEDTRTASRGMDHVAKVSLNTAIRVTGDEADEFSERLDEVAAEQERTNRESKGQLNVADSIDDEYSGLSHKEAQKLCKDRTLNARGSRLELIQRLRDNG